MSRLSSPVAFSAVIIALILPASIGGGLAWSKPNCKGIAGWIQIVVRASGPPAADAHVIMKLSCRRSFVAITILTCARIVSSIEIGPDVLSYFNLPMLDTVAPEPEAKKEHLQDAASSATLFRAGARARQCRLMSEHETGVRTEVSIDHISVFVAQDEDVGALKSRFEDAARNGPRFVEFRTAGGGGMGVLITPRTRIVVTVHPPSSQDVTDVVSTGISDWDL